MSSISLLGDTSGSILIQAPAIAGSGTLTLPTGTATLAINGPAFSAYASTSQTISATTNTKITLDTEEFDTNNNFSSSRFTPTVAGYYQINGGVMVATTNTGYWLQTMIYKNGSQYKRGSSPISGTSTGYPESTASCLVYLNGSTDYVELYVYTNANLNTNATSPYVYLDGFLARAA